jgi:hypothetical protein
MISEKQTSALRQVQESSDEQLQAWWTGFGIKDIGDNIPKGDNWSDWYYLVVSELIYRGFCFQKEQGKECADRDVTVANMCPGCKRYWINAAWLAGKTTEEWIAECAA